jgi:diguanylate cyclase (GGDEF)-like protein/PAS domain S-box-containing protein
MRQSTRRLHKRLRRWLLRLAEGLRARQRGGDALHLAAALDNMSQGMAMFDSDQRLIVCNTRYAAIYNLPAELTVPGTLLPDILKRRASCGFHSGPDPDAYVQKVIAVTATKRASTNEYCAPDGRTIFISHWPLPDGGWMSIHEDVTARRKAEQELNRTKKLVDTVIENVPVAILVREPEKHRYVLINRAAEQFVGISREKVLGKTAYDIFPKARADLITEHDRLASDDANVPLVITDHVIQIPGGTQRTVTTKKLTVHAENDDPLCLIAVIEDVTEKRAAEERIAFLAHHDALTGLPNRAQFSNQLEDALEWVARGTQLAVLFLDLDHFKNVNDTLGHFIGDELLKAVADRLRQCVRALDLIGRLGGDEFAVVLTAIGQPADAARLAMRIQEAVKAPYDLSGIQTVVDVSIGIALAPGDAADATELMKRADMALYQAKSEGRSRYRFFEPAMDAAMKARRKLDTELRSALIRNEFELHYQPIIELATNTIVGMEGLLRWRHPSSGMVAPAEFIPVAEESGLIIPMGEWVIRQACADAAKWPNHIRIALNLSPVQFRSPTLVLTVVNALATSGITPSRLELEITEDVLLKHNPENLTALEHLRNLGVRIVMDDFGSGYSSLNYLRRFPFDKVKIDRSFVHDVAEANDEPRAIVQAIVTLATALKVSTTAEGVETPEQLAFLRAAGCTEYQGFLFSAAKPAREAATLLRRAAGKMISAA